MCVHVCTYKNIHTHIYATLFKLQFTLPHDAYRRILLCKCVLNYAFRPRVIIDTSREQKTHASNYYSVTLPLGLYHEFILHYNSRKIARGRIRRVGLISSPLPRVIIHLRRTTQRGLNCEKLTGAVWAIFYSARSFFDRKPFKVRPMNRWFSGRKRRFSVALGNVTRER